MSKVRPCPRCGNLTAIGGTKQTCEDVDACIERGFWAKVDMSSGPDACWPWTGPYSPDGYGKFSYRNKARGERFTLRAHRFAMTSTGVALGVLMACHRCDNPKCCNPAHLFAGTVQENVDDCIAKGRKAKGGAVMRPDQTRLTAEDVYEVRAAHGNPAALVAFAEKFNMHPQSIRRIARGARMGWR